MSRSQSIPVLVGADDSRATLERVYLGAGLHSERWLQDLIHRHPAILPVPDIEPGFGDLIATAREVPCGHGFIDNLYLTPAGDIVLVETKLWRNPEMRREVVAQALDYVAALTAMSFSLFEAAVARGEAAPKRLYDLVSSHPDALDEPRFIDAVTRNLRLGRMLVMIVGDGIRQETEVLHGLLQSHAGAHFTFALVEIATWRNQAGDILAVPSTLAKTVTIERGIVRIEEGQARIEPIKPQAQVRAQSLSMGDFWDKIAERDPALPATIRAFLTAVEPLGVYADLKSGLLLRADVPDLAKPLNLGSIARNGQLWTNGVAGSAPEKAWRPYLDALAALVGGTTEPGNQLTLDGKSAPRIEQLLPAHQEAWITELAAMIRSASDM